MEAWVSRRRMLALSAAAVLAPELLSCSKGKSKGAPEDKDDLPDYFDFGYDPNAKEPVKTEPPKHDGQVGQKASVKAEWLPPVGDQKNMPICFAWATAYGLATFNAARKSNKSPTSHALQASPDYAAIRYQLEARKMAVNTCKGSQVGPFLDWIKSNGGIPSLEAAPSYAQQTQAASCTTNWSKYGSQAIAPDPRFVVDYKAIQINGPDGLNNLRTVISAGSPICFGTHLYKDFKKYRGKPSVYVGGGDLILKSNGKPDGHVMLIIGYDDTYRDNKGAVRLQNSWGTGWGDKGYAWVAYDTLEKLVEGTGFYAPESA
jgi:hypothetical protein